jgi:hypothetical protein
MTIKVENLQAIERAVKQRIQNMTPVFQDALKLENERIKTRTQSGLNGDGQPFANNKYSKKWAKRRENKGLQTNYVDLTFSGAMFNAMKVSFGSTETTTTGVISFTGKKEAKKAIENEMYGRYFFNLTEEQIEIIKNKLRNVK